MQAKYDRIRKENKKSSKDKWGNCDVIPLFPLLGVNHCLSLLHMSNTQKNGLIDLKLDI